MKNYYECHITLEGDRAAAKACVEGMAWKFSAIDGDPVTGPGVKLYATRHFNAKHSTKDIIEILHNVANWFEEVGGFKITRRKVELVLYDDRSSKVRPCIGGCVECHLDDFYQTEGVGGLSR